MSNLRYGYKKLDCLLELKRNVTSARSKFTNAFIGTYTDPDDGIIKEGFFTCDSNYQHKVGDICAVVSYDFSREKISFKLKNEYLKKAQPLTKVSPITAIENIHIRLDCYPFRAFKKAQDHDLFMRKLTPPYIGCVVEEVTNDRYKLSIQVLYLPIHPKILGDDGKIRDEYLMFGNKLNIYHDDLRWDEEFNVYGVTKCRCECGKPGHSDHDCDCEKEVVGKLLLKEVYLVLQ